MNSNTYDYRTSLFAIFCRLYAHSTYKLSTRILVMDYTYKWASHYGERIVSNSQGGQSFSQVAIISLYNFWSFYFFFQSIALRIYISKVQKLWNEIFYFSCDFIFFWPHCTNSPALDQILYGIFQLLLAGSSLYIPRKHIMILY